MVASGTSCIQSSGNARTSSVDWEGAATSLGVIDGDDGFLDIRGGRDNDSSAGVESSAVLPDRGGGKDGNGGNSGNGGGGRPPQLEGEWINVSTFTGGVTRLVIEEGCTSGEKATLRVWGRCSRGDCAWGHGLLKARKKVTGHSPPNFRPVAQSLLNGLNGGHAGVELEIHYREDGVLLAQAPGCRSGAARDFFLRIRGSVDAWSKRCATVPREVEYLRPTIVRGGRKLRLDWCFFWEQRCGQEAADAFCRLRGHERALELAQDPSIGCNLEPTAIIGQADVFCPGKSPGHRCDGFERIVCGRKEDRPAVEPEGSHADEPGKCNEKANGVANGAADGECKGHDRL